MNKNHLSTGREIIFAGGSWRWKGFAPSLRCSIANSKCALESCLDYSIENIFVTAWGDNGNECSISSSLLILALYSVFDYMGTYDENFINSLLVAICGETSERMLTMDLLDMPDKRQLAPCYNPSKYFLYQDPLFGIFDDQVKPVFSNNYKEFTKILLNSSKQSKQFKYVYKNLANLSYLLELKVDIGVRIRKAYNKHDKKTLNNIANKEIPVIIKRLDKFVESAREQWNKENRPQGFDVIDGRLGYLRNRLVTTGKVLNEFAQGKLKKISELEEKILPYNGLEYEVCWNSWSTTVTPHNL